jgi:hypothetical protein
MTKKNIEFELNNGWQKHLIVCAIQNHVLHKDKQCIPSSNVEKLGKGIESLDQGKAYPMSSWKNWVGNFWKSERTLGSGIWELTPSRLSATKAWLGHWDCILAISNKST